MSSKKVIVVMGATGLQGGSVARFLLKDGTFAVRAVTRRPDSPAAKELAAQGAEVVEADSRDLASLEEAFKGAYGVFGLTNYWEPGVGAEGEILQGKHLVDVAKATGIQHFVWSTLDRSPFKAPHWESKAEVDEYLKKSGVPRTSIYTSFYFENFVEFDGMKLRKRDDGTYDFPLPLKPDAPFAVYAAADTGAYVLAAFLHPETWVNNDLRIASEFLSSGGMAKILSEVGGKTVHVQETYEAMEGKGVSDVLYRNMQVLFANPQPPFRDPSLSRKLYPHVKTFKEWVEANTENIFF